MVPGRAVLEHGVEDYQQLAHAGGQSQLFRLAGRQQALVEVPYDRIEAAGYQRPHVEGCADPGPSTPDGAFAPQGTTVPVEGSHAHQGSDLSAVESAQFGRVCQKGKRDLVLEVLEQAITCGEFDTVMVEYSAFFPHTQRLISMAKERDVGVIAMRPLGGSGRMSSIRSRIASGYQGILTPATLLRYGTAKERLGSYTDTANTTWSE